MIAKGGRTWTSEFCFVLLCFMAVVVSRCAFFKRCVETQISLPLGVLMYRWKHIEEVKCPTTIYAALTCAPSELIIAFTPQCGWEPGMTSLWLYVLAVSWIIVAFNLSLRYTFRFAINWKRYTFVVRGPILRIVQHRFYDQFPRVAAPRLTI